MSYETALLCYFLAFVFVWPAALALLAALALRFGVRLARRVRRWVDDFREPFDVFED